MSISDGQRVRAAESNAAWASKTANNTLTGIQSLESPSSGGNIADAQQELNDINADIGDLVTLSGVPINNTDLGTFTGTTISDNVVTKVALQQLETSLETKASNTVPTTAVINNNEAAPVDVSALFVSGLSYTGATIHYHINRSTDSKDSIATGKLVLFRRNSTLVWDIGVQEWSGFDDDVLSDPAGVTFTVLTSGANDDAQVQYISHDLTGTTYAGVIKFYVQYF